MTAAAQSVAIRVGGRIVAAKSEQPIRGARIQWLPDAIAVRSTTPPQVFETRSNSDGTWTLSGVPSESGTLRISALGYNPVELTWNSGSATAVGTVRLTELAPLLDTVKTVSTADRFDAGFDRRRRSIPGRFLDSADVRRTGVIETSLVLERQPGLHLEQDQFFMRSAFGNTGFRGARTCRPMFWLDGLPMNNLKVGELDTAVPFSKLARIEIYDEARVPPQFQAALSGCGSIVIWTK